jgi:hypothetical protein
MQKPIHARVVLLPLLRVKGCAVNCEDTIEWTVFSVHLLFGEGLLPLLLVDQIQLFPLLRTVCQFICHYLIDELGSRRRNTLVSRASGNADYQHQCDFQAA